MFDSKVDFFSSPEATPQEVSVRRDGRGGGGVWGYGGGALTLFSPINELLLRCCSAAVLECFEVTTPSCPVWAFFRSDLFFSRRRWRPSAECHIPGALPLFPLMYFFPVSIACEIYSVACDAHADCLAGVQELSRSWTSRLFDVLFEDGRGAAWANDI